MTQPVDLVIYHKNCIDGFASAYAASLKYPNAEFVPMLHGDTPPDVLGRNVLIVDFSFKRGVLFGINERAASLRVFDHHKTAQEDLEGLSCCVFDMNRSGAGITWDELFADAHPSVAPRPWWVSYVEDRDLWAWKLPKSKEVNAFIGTWDFSFDVWRENIRTHGIHASADKGAGALAQIDRYVKEMAEQSREVWIGGFTAKAVCAPHVNISELAGHLAQTDLYANFALGYYQRRDGKWQYSLRSRSDFDVSEFAKRFGGGGHKQAAGFVHELPLDELVIAIEQGTA